MNEEYFASLTLQKENVINKRKVFLYLISSSIGNIIAVEYEDKDYMLHRKLFDENYEKAEAYFDSVCRKKLAGKL